MRMGVMITSKCNFKCDHCMFSCTSRGKHMDDNTIEEVRRFIEDNRSKIYEINIYGGEPFLDIEHFDKCFKAFYDEDKGFHISSNGSFLTNPKSLEYVWDLCRIFQENTDDLGGKIRISNTKFHDKFRSDKQKKALNKLKWTLEEPFTWHENYCSEDDEYSINPLKCTEDLRYVSQPIYIDSWSDEGGVNPSGRALKTNAFADYSKRCNCVLTANMRYYNNLHGMFVDCASINISNTGEVGMCCFCDCGKVGHISEFKSFDEIEKAVLKFRSQFREKYNFGNDTKMCDACYLCKKFKVKR